MHYRGDSRTKASKSRYELVVTKKTVTFQPAWTPATNLVIPSLGGLTLPRIIHPDWSSGLGLSLGTNESAPTANGGGVDSGIGYSYNGDAGLDGRVNADDYYRIDTEFSTPPAEEPAAAGELSFGSGINADDYYLIDQAFLGGGA